MKDWGKLAEEAKQKENSPVMSIWHYKALDEMATRNIQDVHGIANIFKGSLELLQKLMLHPERFQFRELEENDVAWTKNAFIFSVNEHRPLLYNIPKEIRGKIYIIAPISEGLGGKTLNPNTKKRRYA